MKKMVLGIFFLCSFSGSVISKALPAKPSRLQVAQGYLYLSGSTVLFSSAPNTTAPRYDLKWKAGVPPKGVCYFGGSTQCSKIWISFKKIEKKPESVTFVDAEIVPDPATLRRHIDTKRKLLTL